MGMNSGMYPGMMGMNSGMMGMNPGMMGNEDMFETMYAKNLLKNGISPMALEQLHDMNDMIIPDHYEELWYMQQMQQAQAAASQQNQAAPSAPVAPTSDAQ